jgi:hypothetical protein
MIWRDAQRVPGRPKPHVKEGCATAMRLDNSRLNGVAKASIIVHTQ